LEIVVVGLVIVVFGFGGDEKEVSGEMVRF
jgi:hypothetical protein